MEIIPREMINYRARNGKIVRSHVIGCHARLDVSGDETAGPLWTTVEMVRVSFVHSIFV